MPEAAVRAFADGPAARIEMAWPEKRNALSAPMMDRLVGAIREADRDPAARAIVLASTGKAFSAGHDLRELREQDLDGARAIFAACHELMAAIRQSDTPVIAEVRGVATAAGCQLVATADLAVASDQARFATPGVRIGLFCSTPMVALSRVVPQKAAMEMLLTGDFVDAPTALRWGLVNRVVPESDLRRTTNQLVEKIAASSPRVVALGKAAFRRQREMPVEDASRAMSEVMSRNTVGPDAREGMAAFLEKRRPEWPLQ